MNPGEAGSSVYIDANTIYPDSPERTYAWDGHPARPAIRSFDLPYLGKLGRARSEPALSLSKG
jgi:hypothetical protein